MSAPRSCGRSTRRCSPCWASSDEHSSEMRHGAHRPRCASGVYINGRSSSWSRRRHQRPSNTADSKHCHSQTSCSTRRVIVRPASINACTISPWRSAGRRARRRRRRPVFRRRPRRGSPSARAISPRRARPAKSPVTRAPRRANEIVPVPMWHWRWTTSTPRRSPRCGSSNATTSLSRRSPRASTSTSYSADATWIGTRASQFARLAARSRSRARSALLHLQFDVDAGREVETLERFDRLSGRFDDVDQPLMDAHLEVLAAVLVDVR